MVTIDGYGGHVITEEEIDNRILNVIIIVTNNFIEFNWFHKSMF